MKTGNNLFAAGQTEEHPKLRLKREKMRKRINKQSSRACWHAPPLSMGGCNPAPAAAPHPIRCSKSGRWASYLLGMRARAGCLNALSVSGDVDATQSLFSVAARFCTRPSIRCCACASSKGKQRPRQQLQQQQQTATTTTTHQSASIEPSDFSCICISNFSSIFCICNAMRMTPRWLGRGNGKGGKC